MNENSKSPWRIPVFWLVVGLPLLSVVAGVGLVITSVRSGGSDAVSDPVRRVSQIQTANLGPDEAAKKRGLSVVLRVEDGMVEVLPATGDFAMDHTLQLVLEHPTRQADDVSLELVPQGPGWRTGHNLDHGHDWRVQLRDAQGQWRLHGRLPRQQHATRLSPSLGTDR